MAQKIDMTGKRFGRLTVIGQAPRPVNSHYTGLYWKCRCDCGKEVVVYGASLRNGLTRSCGCLSRETTSQVRTTHGMKGTRLYNTWQNMRKRCYYSKCRSYADYGARGIKVCPEWQKFEPFMEWAMSHGYRDDLTIERIDVDGDYCPENCTWIPMAKQATNKTTSHMLTVDGETHCINEWVRITGVSRSAIKYRLSHGWDVKRAIYTPMKSKEDKPCAN